MAADPSEATPRTDDPEAPGGPDWRLTGGLKYRWPLEDLYRTHALIPHAVVTDARLDAPTLRVYLRLLYYGRAVRSFPGAGVLAEEVGAQDGLDEAGVTQALDALVRLGYARVRVSPAGLHLELPDGEKVATAAGAHPLPLPAPAPAPTPATTQPTVAKLALLYRDLRHDGRWPSKARQAAAFAQARSVLTGPTPLPYAVAEAILRWMHGDEFWGPKGWHLAMISEQAAAYNRTQQASARKESSKGRLEVVNPASGAETPDQDF